MYTKSESDNSVYYTINRADIRRNCRWYNILASLPGGNVRGYISLWREC